MMQRALVIAGIWLTACGPKSEPAKTAEPAAAASGEPVPGAAPMTSAAPSASAAPVVEAAPAPVAEAKPATPSIHDVCFEMCDKVKAKCPKNSFDACRVNCSKYESPNEGCEDVVKNALICARDAADLVCANVAPESCAKPFRQITACASGQKPTTEAAPTTAALPPGFVLFESAQEGVRAPMPEGAKADGAAFASAKHADGATYSIRKLPRPEGKLNEKVFLKIGMNLFGRCSDKMKMQGMVDKPGRTSIHYTTKCPDGTEEQGLFWATEKALFVATAKGQPGKLGPTDAFLYGFEAK
ncbi:MAG TPA: hypothetical protein VHP33_04575 [Polyangiaceae bacterium]|nr:hypothetical protein [Polyangiaceae bacterium]